MKCSLLFAFAFLLLSSSKILSALEQNTGVWLDASVNDNLAKHPKIQYTLEGQTRFQNHADYYEFSLLQAGLGYRFTRKLSFWAGYQWNSHNDIYGGKRSNEIYEQMIWENYKNDLLTLRTRTRFEQINTIHESHWENIFRERISIYFPEKFFKKWTPVIYDEIFVELNKQATSDNRTLSENRIFLGMDIPTSDIIFWEIGYLQQAEFNTIGNTLNHFIYIGINVNPTLAPIPEYVK